ncbi:unnamed protein product [Diabrotica balteata]|uniref:Uncharacterized protein n=1 Tax=Diabrotica balteata TaxID=107213 RepID=A0A9N9T5Q5_DIABA|nr:unnamed protein product [Diabrotica balteata]
MEEIRHDQPPQKLNPIERTNVISRLFFCWLIPYFAKGYKRDLTEDDMYKHRSEHDSGSLGAKLERRWNKHIQNNKNPAYWKVLMGTFFCEIFLLNILAFTTEGIRMSQPFLISKLLKVYEEIPTEESMNDIYLYAGLIIVTSFLNVILVHRFNLAVMQIGMKMRIASCSLIYRKSLKLSKSALAETTIGQMVNLLSNDVGRFDQATHHLHHFYLAPIQTTIVMVLLYLVVGWTALLGTVFLLLSIPLQSWLGKKTSQFRLKTATRTDERVRLMNEIISGIQVIKMYTWEYSFAKLVEYVRKVNIQQWNSTKVIINSTDPDAEIYHSFENWWLTPLFTSKNTVYFYTILVGSVVIIVNIRSLSFYLWCIAASTKMHNKMFMNIVYSPMRFFNTNPSGRILNRFSKDIGSVDEVLPTTLLDTVQIALSVAAITAVIGSLTYWILIPTVAIAVFFYFLRVIFLETSRDVKRVESVTRSPIYTHLTASLQGLTTIRAFRAQDILKEEFDRYQNLHSAAFFMYLAANRTFGFWLDFICVIYVGLVIVALVFVKSEQYGGNMGLALTQTLGLTGMFQWGMRQWSELENQMTSVERVQEYADLKQEDDEHSIEPPKTWPHAGEIQFDNMSLYYTPDDPPVLKNLSFTINPSEKIGIVGRTGAGKSSLIQALFRLTHIEGRILVDDIDTKKISLKMLRSKISIIPQEPVLFSGTLRNNLDPFDEYTDEALWNALEEVELKQAVDELPAGLANKMAEGGTNFSVGQRQLVCLARAIVGNNKILVLDEATANVDPYTDALIQKTIRKKFANCTVLTIAHRLNTIMDSDKVLVMDAGKAVEFDHPFTLLKNINGVFYSLVMQTGKTTAKHLIAIAEQSKTIRDNNTVF